MFEDNLVITVFFFQESCPEGVDPIMLSILMDVGIDDIDPKTRITLIENIAGYLGLNKVGIVF